MKRYEILFIVLMPLLFIFSCTAGVKEIKMSEDQHQIVAETKGKDMDETMTIFHEKARSVCQGYEIVNINTDVTFDWGLFIWTAVPLNKRTVTGVIKCKQPVSSEIKTSPSKVDFTPKPQEIPPEKPITSTPVTPSSAANIVTVTWTFANVRSGAGNNYPVVTTVKQGDKLTVIGELGEWFNVRLEDGKEGWISNKVVK